MMAWAVALCAAGCGYAAGGLFGAITRTAMSANMPKMRPSPNHPMPDRPRELAARAVMTAKASQMKRNKNMTVAPVADPSVPIPIIGRCHRHGARDQGRVAPPAIARRPAAAIAEAPPSRDLAAAGHPFRHPGRGRCLFPRVGLRGVLRGESLGCAPFCASTGSLALPAQRPGFLGARACRL